jgi:hypothetical protein
VVLTRRRDTENPQARLWDAAGYNYAAYVTDLDGAPEDIAACYDKRADMEKALHELKEDFGNDAQRSVRCCCCSRRCRPPCTHRRTLLLMLRPVDAKKSCPDRAAFVASVRLRSSQRGIRSAQRQSMPNSAV